MTQEQEAKLKKIIIMVTVIILIGMGVFLGIQLKRREKLQEELTKLASTQEIVQEEPEDITKEISQEQVVEEVVLEKDKKINSEDNVIVVNLYPNMKKTSAKSYRSSKEREKDMYEAGIASEIYNVKFEETDLGVVNNIVAKKDNEFISGGEFLELVKTNNLMVLFK